MVAGVLVVGDDELVVAHLDAAQHPLLLRDKLGEILLTQIVGIIGEYLVAGSVLVGIDINLAIVHPNGVEGKLAVLRKFHIVRIQALEVFHIEGVALASTLQDEHITLILIDTHLMEQQRVIVAAILKVVLALGRAQLVVHHLVPLVLRALGILGLVIGAVEETVAQPLCIGELGPHDVVVEHLVVEQVMHQNLVPVAAVAGDGVGGIATVLREVEALQGHGAVGA